MRRSRLRAAVCFLAALAASSCGGGGGGGGTSPSPPPPPGGGSSQATIDAGNATLVAAVGNAFMESYVQLGLAAMNDVFALSDSRALSTAMDCDNFSTGGTITLVDNDGNGLVSNGDVVELDYNNCRTDVLGDFATGRINVAISSFSLDASLDVAGTFGIDIPANLTFDAGNGAFVDVAGAFELSFVANSSLENIDVSTSGTQSLTIVIRDATTSNTEVADQVSISRSVVTSNFQSSYDISGSWDVDSATAGGELSCGISSNLTGAVPLYPDSGTLICTGDGNSAVRVVAAAGTMGNTIVTEVDPQGDGTFVDAGVIQNGGGVWGDYVEGVIFGVLVEGPRNDPALQIPDVSSVSMPIAIGDSMVDAVYDASADRVYVTTGTGLEVIDPTNMTIVDTLTFTDRPAQIDLSDDGSTLWIAFRFASYILPIDTATLNEGARVDLGTSSTGGERFAADLQVAPGTTDTVVVATRNAGEVVVYRAGTPLPDTVDVYGAPTVIEFSDADTILGVNGANTGFHAAEISFGPTGVSLVRILREFSNGFVDHIAVNDGVIWLESGRAVDVANERIQGRLISVLVGAPGFSDAAYIDAANDTAWYYGTSGDIIELFDMQTFTQLGAYRMPAPSSREVRLFEAASGEFLVVLDNELHRVDKAAMAPTLLGKACSTIDLGAQFGVNVFVQIDCSFNDVVYDSSRDLLYASVPSTNGPDGNSVAIIDPQTGNIQRYVFVGSEPAGLTISGGGTRLFVALEQANAIAEVDLQSQQLVATIRLENEPPLEQPSFASAVAASTQTETDVLVATFEEVAVYSGAVQSASVATRVITAVDAFYSEDATRAYAATDNRYLWSFDVDATGVLNGVETRDIVTPSGVKFDDGEIFDYLGRIVDPDTATVVGNCPSVAIAVEPDPANDDVYYLISGLPNRVEVCDRVSLMTTKSFDLPNFGGGFFRPVMRRAGDRRLVIMDDNKLKLIDPTEY